MNTFKQFQISIPNDGFTGDKIKISKILNREITVIAAKIVNSNYEGKGKRLDIQIELNSTKHIIFTGSTGLIKAIEQIPTEGYPFTTTIIQNDERYEFS